MIKPTIGRVVWYTPGATDPQSDQKMPALVSYVWSDTCVNLAVFDSNGKTFNSTSVHLKQEDSEMPTAPYCEWMPYQKMVAYERAKGTEEAA